jgi:hypothetical protein
MTRKILLVCGGLSSLLYLTMTAAIAQRWEGYSSAARTISELSAIGAPTRPVWVAAAALYTVLVTAFGWGVYMSAGGARSLRIAGVLIGAYGALGLVWPFFPMHSRDVLAAGGGSLTDTMHIVWSVVTVLLMLFAIAFAAAAFGRRFLLYSVGSLLLLVTFGVLTFLDSPGVAANTPTPWIGVWERLDVAVFLVWVVVLALALEEPRTARHERRHDDDRHDQPELDRIDSAIGVN